MVDIKAIPRELLNNEEPFNSTYISRVNKSVAEGFVHEKEEVIKAAFVKNNILYEEEFIKQHISVINQEGDCFEHYWYNWGEPDAMRIISIEKQPRFDYVEENFGLKLRAEANYY